MGTGKTYSTKYLLDSNNNSGVAGQVLSTTSTGIDWVDANTLPGTGLWLASGNNIYNSNSGNVGIGTDSPQSKLHLATTGGSTLTIQNTTNSGNAALNFRDEGDNDQFQIYYALGANRSYNLVNGNGLTVYSSQSSSEIARFGNASSGYTDSYFTGDVGIGTTSPDGLLNLGHVASTSSISEDASDYALTFNFTGTTNDYGRHIAIRDNNGDAVASIGGVDLGGAGTTGLYFATGSVSGISEAMRITATGNVGIGTTTVQNKLVVRGSGSAFNSTMQNSTASIISKELTDNAYHSILQLVAVRQSLTTGKDSQGYLGFSTIDDSNNQGQLDAGRIAIVNEIGSSRNSATALTFWTNPGGTQTTAAVEKMRITSSGNVGIGTTSPSSKLQVSGDAYVTGQFGQGVAIANKIAAYGGEFRASGASAQIFFGRSGSSVGSGAIGADSTYVFRVWTTPGFGNPFVIKQDGNVGIGTTAPKTFLDVSGQGNRPGGNIIVGAQGDGSGKFSQICGTHYNAATEPEGISMIGIYSNSTNNSVHIGGNIYESNPATDINFWTHTATTHAQGGTQRMRINSAGAIRFNAYGAGTLVSDASGNITVSSGGGAGGPYLPLAGGTMTGTAGVVFPDNFNLKIGTGSDLKIFHNATDSFIINEVGNLKITNGANDKDIIFESDNGSGGVEPYMTLNGSNRSIVVSAALGVYHNDGIASRFGNAGDLQIYHNATNSIISNSTGHLYIKTTVADKDIIFEASNGAGSVESYLEIDSSQQDIKVNKRIEMTGTGSAGGQHAIEFNPGTSAIGYIYHDDTNFNVRAIKASSDLVLEATHGNVQILNGSGSGTEVGVMIEQYIAHIGDTDTKFGFTAANQFQVIAGGNTNLNVQGNGVDLSYAGSTKLTTQTGGIAITGDLTVTADVGIGLTNPDVPLHVTTNEDGSGIDKGAAKFINTNTGQGATTMHMVQTSSSNFANAVKFWQGSTPTAVGFIRLTTSATQFITSASDLNLKKNITNWSDDTLSKFKALEPKKFRFKTQDVSEDKTLGFIAQNEVDNFPEAYPQFLGDDEKPYYGFNPTGMVPHLMKAIKDLVEKVEILENKITQLENNN